MTARRLLVLASLAASSILAASCSGDVEEPSECSDPVPADTVRLEDFAFEPDCLTAPAESSIALENTGDAPHTFTVEGTHVDVDVATGDAADASLSDVEPGRYLVTCTYHPQMTATLTVEAQ
jgi:plastocyanin